MGDANPDSQDPEAPEEDLEGEHAALLHFGKYHESRRVLPWQQWTFKEKVNYCIDRVFLGILVIFLLMLLGEFAIKMWHVTNVNKIAAFVSESVVWSVGWLFRQDEQEELTEL